MLNHLSVFGWAILFSCPLLGTMLVWLSSVRGVDERITQILLMQARELQPCRSCHRDRHFQRKRGWHRQPTGDTAVCPSHYWRRDLQCLWCCLIYRRCVHLMFSSWVQFKMVLVTDYLLWGFDSRGESTISVSLTICGKIWTFFFFFFFFFLPRVQFTCAALFTGWDLSNLTQRYTRIVRSMAHVQTHIYSNDEH